MRSPEQFWKRAAVQPQGIDVDGSSTASTSPTRARTRSSCSATPVRSSQPEGPTGVTDTSITLTGNVDPAGRGDITECRFEYGFDTTYGSTCPARPIQRRRRRAPTSPPPPTSPRRSRDCPRGRRGAAPRRRQRSRCFGLRSGPHLQDDRCAGDRQPRRRTPDGDVRRPHRASQPQRAGNHLPLRIRAYCRVR